MPAVAGMILKSHLTLYMKQRNMSQALRAIGRILPMVKPFGIMQSMNGKHL